jgi:hypothetical protein
MHLLDKDNKFLENKVWVLLLNKLQMLSYVKGSTFYKFHGTTLCFTSSKILLPVKQVSNLSIWPYSNIRWAEEEEEMRGKSKLTMESVCITPSSYKKLQWLLSRTHSRILTSTAQLNAWNAELNKIHFHFMRSNNMTKYFWNVILMSSVDDLISSINRMSGNKSLHN